MYSTVQYYPWCSIQVLDSTPECTILRLLPYSTIQFSLSGHHGDPQLPDAAPSNCISLTDSEGVDKPIVGTALAY